MNKIFFKKFIFLMVLFIGLLFSYKVLALEVELPPLNYHPQVPEIFGSEIKVEGTTLSKSIAAVYKYGVSLGIILAVIMIMFGGFTWLTAAGAPDKINNAKGYIGSALIGLVVLLYSYFLLANINPALVEIKDLQIKGIEKVKVGCDWFKEKPVGYSLDDDVYCGEKPKGDKYNEYECYCTGGGPAFCGSGYEEVEMAECEKDSKDNPKCKTIKRGYDEKICCCSLCNSANKCEDYTTQTECWGDMCGFCLKGKDCSCEVKDGVCVTIKEENCKGIDDCSDYTKEESCKADPCNFDYNEDENPCVWDAKNKQCVKFL